MVPLTNEINGCYGNDGESVLMIQTTAQFGVGHHFVSCVLDQNLPNGFIEDPSFEDEFDDMLMTGAFLVIELAGNGIYGVIKRYAVYINGATYKDCIFLLSLSLPLPLPPSLSLPLPLSLSLSLRTTKAIGEPSHCKQSQFCSSLLCGCQHDGHQRSHFLQGRSRANH